MRSHDLAVGSCGTNGQQVATMRAIQVNLLGKDIGRFADGSNDIVCIGVFVAAQVLNLVIGLIEGRADEVGEACIDDGKLLDGAFFYI